MPKHDIILQRLQAATERELNEVCDALQIPHTKDVPKISNAYRTAAGHLVTNLFKEAYSYKKILIIVAEKLKTWCLWPTGYSLHDNTSEIAIEEAILGFVNERIKKELTKQTTEDRKKAAKQIEQKLRQLGYNSAITNTVVSAVISGTVGTLSAAPVTLSLFYSGIFASIWAAIFGTSTFLLLLSGTGVGIIVAVPVFLTMLGGPAYRKIIPATLQLILIRKRLEAEKRLAAN